MALVTLGGVTALEPDQSWVPRLDCRAAEGAGSRCRQTGPLCTRSAWSSLHGTTLSRSPQPSYRESKPRAPRGWGSIWAAGAFKRPMGSASPGAGLPSSSLLPLGRPTYGRRHPQQRGVAALGSHPGAGSRLRGKKSGDTSLGCFFWRIPLELRSQEQDSP